MTERINVTKPFLPPLDEIIPDLEAIWQSGVLTNGGPLHERLESELSQFLGVPYVSLFCNATAALMVAQKALRLTGQFVTTPYSFAATSHAFAWTGMEPIFVDISPDSMTIDPAKIAAAITPATTAIVPVHCYGNTCPVTEIAEIAERYGLKVLYDACHSFGVEDIGGGVFRYGDLSVVSFHATKVFNTFEGGLIACASSELKQKIDRLKNFGFVDETTVNSIGINGKMSEFNAAVGLAQLRYFDQVIEMRGAKDRLYRELLGNIQGVHVFRPVGQVKRNFSYFPIFVDDHYPLTRDELYEKLRKHDVLARRYFYPLISEFPMYKSLPSASPDNLATATRLSKQVLCLPLHPHLTESQIHYISELVTSANK